MISYRKLLLICYLSDKGSQVHWIYLVLFTLNWTSEQWKLIYKHDPKNSNICSDFRFLCISSLYTRKRQLSNWRSSKYNNSPSSPYELYTFLQMSKRYWILEIMSWRFEVQCGVGSLWLAEVRQIFIGKSFDDWCKN